MSDDAHWTDDLVNRVALTDEGNWVSKNGLKAVACLSEFAGDFDAQADFCGLLMDEIERLREACNLFRMHGIPPHDVSGKRAWEKAIELSSVDVSDVECTCYEVINGGHQMGCAFYKCVKREPRRWKIHIHPKSPDCASVCHTPEACASEGYEVVDVVEVLK